MGSQTSQFQLLRSIVVANRLQVLGRVTALLTAAAGLPLMQSFDFGSMIRITVWSVFLLVAFFTGCH
jgi:hypothetical protein